jgi:hypothetical protein
LRKSMEETPECRILEFCEAHIRDQKGGSKSI